MKKLLFILLFFALKAQGQTINFSNSDATATPGAVVTINSSTYVASRTYIFLVGTFAASTPTDNPTISSGGLTLTKRGTQAGGFNDRWIIYTADVPSDVTTAITFTFAESQNTKVSIIYYTDLNVSRSYAVAGATGSTADPSISLTARTASVISAFSNNANPFTGTPESGWTEDVDAGFATPTGRYSMHRDNTTDYTPTVTSSASNWTGIAIQIYGRRRIIIDYFWFLFSTSFIRLRRKKK